MRSKKIIFFWLLSFVLYTGFRWYQLINRLNPVDLVKPIGTQYEISQPLIDFLQNKTPVVERSNIRQYGQGFLFIWHSLVSIAHFNENIIAFLITILNSICIFAIIFMFWKYYANESSLRVRVLFSCIFLNFYTILYCYEGMLMPELVETTLILAAIILYNQKRDIFCSLFLVYAASIKFLPLFLIFLFIFLRRKIFYFSLMWFGVITVISHFLYGATYGISYLWFMLTRPILARDLFALFWENISFKACVARFFAGFRIEGYNLIIQPEQLKYVSLIYYFTGVIFFGIMLWHYYRLKVDGRKALASDFLLAEGSIYLTFFSPIVAWEQYVLSLPAWFIAIKYLKSIIAKRVLLILFCVSIFLTGIVIPFSLFLKIFPINAYIYKLIPSASSFSVSEPYKFVCLPTLGVLCLGFMWFFLNGTMIKERES